MEAKQHSHPKNYECVHCRRDKLVFDLFAFYFILGPLDGYRVLVAFVNPRLLSLFNKLSCMKSQSI